MFLEAGYRLHLIFSLTDKIQASPVNYTFYQKKAGSTNIKPLILTRIIVMDMKGRKKVSSQNIELKKTEYRKSFTKKNCAEKTVISQV
jgi:hypothetical protein